MTQPNCYFTLEAPFLTLIGLYSNVPEGGEIHNDQIDWFVGELRAAPREKALLVAVRRHPMINSSWDEAAQEIVVKRPVNLGIAVAAERGLLVPNVKGADGWQQILTRFYPVFGQKSVKI